MRASQARPTPGDDAAHPLGRDRFGIDEALERQRADHRNEHGEGSLRLEGFSHPACAGIEPARKRRCPFLAVRWGRARDLPGAVEVELQEEVDVAELRREMLCHLAFGRTGSETRCPLHVEGVQVRSERRAGRWVFQLAAEGKRLEELRARIRRLVR